MRGKFSNLINQRNASSSVYDTKNVAGITLGQWGVLFNLQLITYFHLPIIMINV